jgi:ABC-type ATPase with predicted acetyltransferase domain
LKLANGKIVRVPRYASVGEGDDVVIRNPEIVVCCSNGDAQIHPSYNRPELLRTGGFETTLHIKEITTVDEMKSYRYLSEFHYRNKGLYGRKAVLVAVSRNEKFPNVLGYVELTTAFLMNRPRDRLLDTHISLGHLSWQNWDNKARRNFTNLIVRIARVVVHPEFRGLGLSKLLLRHSFCFAKKHWQVARVKPEFVEITADMLKFVPFAEAAGMYYIGQTEGNLNRVRKDLRYIFKNLGRVRRREIYRKESNAMVELQLNYMKRALKTAKTNGLGKNGILPFLDSLSENISLRKYRVLHGLIRFPKPVYFKGLSNRSERIVKRRVDELGPVKRHQLISGHAIKPINEPIEFRHVDLSFRTAVKLTKRTSIVEEAFGILPEDLKITVFKNINLTIRPGEVVLVSGGSGVGKTALLQLLIGELRPSYGTVYLPSNAKIANFRPLQSDKPLVEIIGNDVGNSIRTLNMAGLCEAYLYLRRFDELSKGQQYRAMLARLLCTNANIWIADDFCATLDPIIANVVAENFSMNARRRGATAIIAAPHFASFIRALKPDTIIAKHSGWDYKVFHEPFQRDWLRDFTCA